ncbi:hypothetical protein L21TH_2068 [Caldisalinibacter kiritimatiensis]|uniref:Uncharacterized protein n=2 Tax=Caldisalinibacter kiritimatiensis TaxID=1304284 RepID=R1ATD5_9FIRM|nr:hypothetical protein L21TH_2068 [Caldisalinibacter kiritimatiensis]
MIDIRSEIRIKENELEKLAPLPEEFQSPNEFKKYLSNKAKELENINEEYEQYKEQYYELERQLPDFTFEEFRSFASKRF